MPASELAKLTALQQLDIQKNEGLTITASGKQEIERAAPKAQFEQVRVAACRQLVENLELNGRTRPHAL